MKQVSFFSTFSFLLLLISFMACQKPVEGTLPEGPVVNPPSVSITASLSGRVTDENGQPVSGALVRSGAATATTSVNGEFAFSNIQVDKENAYVHVSKQGYFKGSRTFTAKNGMQHFVTIELIPAKIAGTVNAVSGGTITVPSGGSVVFPANSVTAAGGNAPYTGTVSVAAYFLNPVAPNFSAIMPGALRGVTTGGESRGLQSFSMMAVELQGASGEKLQLATGKSATVTFPIATELQAQAPATIPLWHFDEEKGLWIEEGQAVKQGSQYVGTVSHFSFWNVDAPFALVDFSVTLVDASSKPLARTRIELRATDDAVSQFGYGITDMEGFASGKIPAGRPLKMLVYNSCGQVIYTKEIGSFSANTNLGKLSITNTTQVELTVSGTVKNCNAAPVTNGVVSLTLNGTHYKATITNGAFSIKIASCSGASGSLKAFATDFEANKQSDSILVTYSNSTVAPLSLTACGNAVSKFINYNLNGTINGFAAPADSLYSFTSGNFISIFARSMPAGNQMSFDFEGGGVGSYPLNSVFIMYNGGKTYLKEGSMNVTITEYNKTDKIIAGNFSGFVLDSLGNTPVPVSCTFRLKE